MTLRRTLALAAGASGSAFALVATASSAFAQSPEGDLQTGGGSSGFGLGDVFNLGARLALVLLVIWGAVRAMRWYTRRMQGTGSGGSTRQMQVLETRSLGPNRSLQLVRLGSRAVLVGVTPERISSLMAIDDAEEVERIVAAIEGEVAARPLPRLAAGLRTVPAGALGRLLKARNAEAGARPPTIPEFITNLLRARRHNAEEPAALTPLPRRVRKSEGPLASARRMRAASERAARVAALQRAIADVRTQVVQ